MSSCTEIYDLANCTSDTDFASCVGDTAYFCPKGIECSCKDGKPFCKCPYYRGQWGTYWYIGSKCDQLWNTLDLIVMVTLPGVALAFVVAVIAQAIHYCKSKKSNKKVKRDKSNRNQRTINAYNSALGYSQHNNLAYIPEDSGVLQNVLRPQQRTDDWSRPILPLQRPLPQNPETERHQSPHYPDHLKGFNHLVPQLKTVPPRKPNAAFSPYVQDSRSPATPDEDYEEETPIPKFGLFPRVDYRQSINQSAGPTESQWSAKPYGIERSQQPYPYGH
ncbi:uncharacterized protein LOC115475169 [Microcaecilia unicolor]|uniref:Uncharacterized protein LOC115475169 n=1 Tax=Microcaecilia unicolor TaxID=1415580 RepID=A0A6P7YPY9_9AMPH|nr:uncharacterized protein LOC115475169 [Microcaecilia unicolor]